VVRGEIDAGSVPYLKEAMRTQDASPEGYRIDLTGVRYIDSRGIEALFEHAAHGLEITVAGNSLLQRILQTVAMDQVAKVRVRP
jgi:anti-anti-sigma factor